MNIKIFFIISMIICLFNCELFVLDKAKENIYIENIVAQNTNKGSALITYDLINNNDMKSLHIYALQINVYLSIQDISGNTYSKIEKITITKDDANIINLSSYLTTYYNPNISTAKVIIGDIIY